MAVLGNEPDPGVAGVPDAARPQPYAPDPDRAPLRAAQSGNRLGHLHLAAATSAGQAHDLASSDR